MNKILFAVSIIISACVGFFVGRSSNFSEIAASPMLMSEQEQAKISIVEKNTPVLPERNFQPAAVASDGAQITFKSSSSDAVNLSAQQQIDAIKADYEFKQRSEKFTDWLTKNQKEKPWFDLGVEMRGRFEAEERDHEWANSEEGHIQSLFTQKEELSGIAVKSAACKSTQCQITISVMDQEHANETAMAISKVLSGEKFSQIIIDSQVQQGESILYVSRSEKGFEFN